MDACVASAKHLLKRMKHTSWSPAATFEAVLVCSFHLKMVSFSESDMDSKFLFTFASDVNRKFESMLDAEKTDLFKWKLTDLNSLNAIANDLVA